MCIFARRSVAALLVVLLLPAAAFAQAAITGVVRDTSGAVLPGVTVEAASPVLIERTRSVVSDDTGQYRIVDLRPGTYAVTFTLPGFNTVKREGIELSWRLRRHGQRRVASRRARRNRHSHWRIADRGRPEHARAEHRGQGSARGDSVVARRHRDSVAGAGHEQQRRRRRHHRRKRRDGRLHPWRPRLRFADAPRRHQHRVGRRQLECRRFERGGLAGDSADRIRRTGRSRNGRRDAQHHPARRREPVQRHRVRVRRQRRHAGQQLHRRPQSGRTAIARGAQESLRLQPDGWRAHHPGQIVVLPDVPRGCRREHDSGHVLQPERRRSDQMARRLRHQPSLLRGQRDPKCDRATHLAGVTAQQSELQPLPAVRQTEQGRRRHRDAHTRSAGPETLHAWVHSDSDMGITHHQPVAGRGRLGQLLLRVRQPGATGRWHAQPRSDLDPRAVLRRLLRTTAASPG